MNKIHHIIIGIILLVATSQSVHARIDITSPPENEILDSLTLLRVDYDSGKYLNIIVKNEEDVEYMNIICFISPCYYTINPIYTPEGMNTYDVEARGDEWELLESATRRARIMIGNMNDIAPAEQETLTLSCVQQKEWKRNEPLKIQVDYSAPQQATETDAVAPDFHNVDFDFTADDESVKFLSPNKWSDSITNNSMTHLKIEIPQNGTFKIKAISMSSPISVMDGRYVNTNALKDEVVTEGNTPRQNEIFRELLLNVSDVGVTCISE